MKVLHVFKTYLPESFTGIERVIWEICEGTAAHGIESHVLSLSPTEVPKTVAIGHHTAHKAKLDLYIASTGLSRSLFREFRVLAASVDVVHYHFPWPMMDALQLVANPHKPSVVTYHSDIVRQKRLALLYAPVMHRFLSQMDRIVATSPNYVASSAVLQRYRDKVSVIPIGIGESPAPSDAALARWRAEAGERFFLFVGALRYYKGLGFLIEAARQTGLPVVVAGDGEMRAEVERAGLSNVRLVGPISDEDKAALLSLCAGFVFPSHLRSEAFGVALLEGARAGRPMISCEIGTGTSYVNVDSETGLTVPPADPAALGVAMQLLWQDRDRAEAMGVAARSRYEALFTAERMAKSYAGLYRQLAAR